jgi:hypothetical protein
MTDQPIVILACSRPCITDTVELVSSLTAPCLPPAGLLVVVANPFKQSLEGAQLFEDAVFWAEVEEEEEEEGAQEEAHGRA